MRIFNLWPYAKTALLVSLLLLSGCFGIQTTNREAPRTYLLEGEFKKAAKPATIPLSLLVSQPNAAPAYDTARMAYVRHPHEIEYFTRNQWAESPSRMLWPLLVSALEQESGYQVVVPATGLVQGDARLDMEITLLQQEFLSQKSRIHIKLRVHLIEQNEYRILATQTFEVIEDTPSEDPQGGVIAANRALQPLLKQIANFALSHGEKLAAQRNRSVSKKCKICLSNDPIFRLN